MTDTSAVPLQAAQVADQWTEAAHVRLHAGELTLQELRTVQAVARAIAADIRALGEK